MRNSNPITFEVLDADGYTEESAYLTGFDAMDAYDAHIQMLAEELINR